MAKHFKLKANGLDVIRSVNPKLMSYNVEMTEVTGGTFWKAYTKAQVEGKEDFPPLKSMDLSGIMQVYPPINLYNERVRKLPFCNHQNYSGFRQESPGILKP